MTHSSLVADSTERIFREFAPHPLIACDAARRKRLWNALQEAGVTRAWIDEAYGGAGASIADGFEVMRIAGAHAIDVPLIETLLAGWLLMRAEMHVPDGALTLAPIDRRDRFALNGTERVSGSARAVPFAHEVEQVVLLAERDAKMFVALVDARELDIASKSNLAGDARDVVVARDAVTATNRSIALCYDDMQMMGAVARACTMAGALQAVLELAVNHANERIAFTKPIGRFQAVQHSLAKLAGETAAAVAAAGSAADALASASAFDAEVFLEVASAKIRVGEAATVACAIAHQVHGAMGFAFEHPLHCFTQRLLAWRDEFGGESEWAEQLGRAVARKGADALWPYLTTR